MAQLLGFCTHNDILIKIYDAGDDFCCVAHKDGEKLFDRYTSKWYSDLPASEERAFNVICDAAFTGNDRPSFSHYVKCP